MVRALVRASVAVAVLAVAACGSADTGVSSEQLSSALLTVDDVAPDYPVVLPPTVGEPGDHAARRGWDELELCPGARALLSGPVELEATVHLQRGCCYPWTYGVRELLLAVPDGDQAWTELQASHELCAGQTWEAWGERRELECAAALPGVDGATGFRLVTTTDPKYREPARERTTYWVQRGDVIVGVEFSGPVGRLMPVEEQAQVVLRALDRFDAATT